MVGWMENYLQLERVGWVWSSFHSSLSTAKHSCLRRQQLCTLSIKSCGSVQRYVDEFTRLTDLLGWRDIDKETIYEFKLGLFPNMREQLSNMEGVYMMSQNGIIDTGQTLPLTQYIQACLNMEANKKISYGDRDKHFDSLPVGKKFTSSKQGGPTITRKSIVKLLNSHLTMLERVTTTTTRVIRIYIREGDISRMLHHQVLLRLQLLRPVFLKIRITLTWNVFNVGSLDIRLPTVLLRWYRRG